MRGRRAWPLVAFPLLVSCAAGGGVGQPPAPGGGGYYPRVPPPGAPAPPVAFLRFSTPQLNFGAVAPGEISEIDCLLVNEGDTDADVISASAAGRGFRVSRDECSGRPLSPGRSCRLGVRFAPVGAGPVDGVLTVVATDPAPRRLELPLWGEGLRRQAAPEITVEPGEPDFGRVDVGTPAFLDVTVGNTGGRSVRLRETSVIGPGFDVARNGCAGRVLDPRDECVVGLRFVPVRRGSVTGAMRIRTEDPDVPLHTVALAGEGSDPGRPAIRLGARALDFGAVAAGQARSAEVRVESAGRRELHVRSVRVEGRWFAVQDDRCSERSLDPGDACIVVVRFAPVGAGGAQGRLEVLSDDPDASVAVVALAGSGRARQACPVAQLDLDWSGVGDPAPLVVSGVLPRGECLTYELTVERAGRLQVCLPPGYILRAEGFEPAERPGCRIGGDSVVYRRFVRRGISAGTVVDLTLTRQDDAGRDFKASFVFRSPRPRGAPESDAE
ncbi:MAG TPA: choice-of-anchor D domain-containing protein [bacterium]